MDSKRAVAKRCKAALVLVVMMLCVSANAVFTGAEELESDKVSRVRILAAALATRGQWRVALKGTQPAFSAWADGLPFHGSEEQTEEDAEKAKCEEVAAEGAPELRRNSDEKNTLSDTICAVDLVDDASQPSCDDGAAPLKHSEDTAEVDVPALRSMPLRNDDDIPQDTGLTFQDMCALDTDAGTASDAGTDESNLKLREGIRKDGRGHDAHETIKDSSLDKLFEHIDDDVMHHFPPASPPSPSSTQYEHLLFAPPISARSSVYV